MLSLSDALALTRTHLANERTLLAYLRTALALMAAGFGLVHLMERPILMALGWVFIPSGIIVLLSGLVRFGRARSRLASLEGSAVVRDNSAPGG